MHILLTNDDGIHAPGLMAMEYELQKLGTVDVIAPLTEQSGVGHAITYLTPLMAREVYDGPAPPRLGRRGQSGRLREARHFGTLLHAPAVGG